MFSHHDFKSCLRLWWTCTTKLCNIVSSSKVLLATFFSMKGLRGRGAIIFEARWSYSIPRWLFAAICASIVVASVSMTSWCLKTIIHSMFFLYIEASPPLIFCMIVYSISYSRIFFSYGCIRSLLYNLYHYVVVWSEFAFEK